MQIHTLGIDLGKTTFHLVGLNALGKSHAQEVFAQAPLAIHSQSTGRIDWYGGLPESAFSRLAVARTLARSPADDVSIHWLQKNPRTSPLWSQWRRL